MKWITREHPRVDRVACPWLIERFIDKQAEFVYVPTDQVEAEAKRQGANPYDTKGAAMAYTAKVIRGADTGLLHHPDDQAQRKASYPVLDSLYAYCRGRVAKT